MHGRRRGAGPPRTAPCTPSRPSEEARMTQAVRTTCPYCGVGCGVLAQPDGRLVGDPAHPANKGRLCVKGAALGETLDDAGRLLYPTIGGARASWDAALDLVAARFRE